ncbi:hypothetical protein NLG97_g10553 [Lecanicillium saksenae]|uniref:Uncharacterized protein n=1 Tax=Lecanicillium saksenae TaxID=468837 RepID=A0ACC1QFL5_9HYPO|nr:hypothetical protein NLG97_g10553 [Lecanicillium saksenae]
MGNLSRNHDRGGRDTLVDLGDGVSHLGDTSRADSLVDGAVGLGVGALAFALRASGHDDGDDAIVTSLGGLLSRDRAAGGELGGADAVLLLLGEGVASDKGREGQDTVAVNH